MPVRIDTGTGPGPAQVYIPPHAGGSASPGVNTTMAPTQVADYQKYNQLSQADALDYASRSKQQIDQFAIHTPGGFLSALQDPSLTPTHLFMRTLGIHADSDAHLEEMTKNINQWFQQAYGHGPTAGFTLDMLKMYGSRNPAVRAHLAQILGGAKAATANLASGGLEGLAGNPNLLSNTAGLQHGGMNITTANQQESKNLRYLLQTAAMATFANHAEGKVGDSAIATLTGALTSLKDQHDAHEAFDQTIQGVTTSYSNDTFTSIHVTTPTQIAQSMQLGFYVPLNSQATINITKLAPVLAQHGLSYDDFRGLTADQVKDRFKAILGPAAEKRNLHGGVKGALTSDPATTLNISLSAVDAVSAVQRDLIKRYPSLTKDAAVTGLLNGKWPEILKNLQANKGYRFITTLQAAQNAGFGADKFDAFNAVDPVTGSWADNADGREARHEFNRWQEAIHGQASSKKYFQHEGWGIFTGDAIISDLPVAAFNKGGLSPTSLFQYTIGAQDGDWESTWSPSALVHGGFMTATEHTLQSGIRGIEVFNDIYLTGGFNQAARDAFTLEALVPGTVLNDLTGGPLIHSLAAHFGHDYSFGDLSWGQRKRIMFNRAKGSTMPSALQFMLNSGSADKIVAKHLEDIGLSKDTSEKVVNASDAVVTAAIAFYLTKDLPILPGLGAASSAVRDSRLFQVALGNAEKMAMRFDNSGYIVSSLQDAYKAFKNGKDYEGVQALDGGAEIVHTRDVKRIVDPESPTGFRYERIRNRPPHGPETSTDPRPSPGEIHDPNGPRPPITRGQQHPDVMWETRHDLNELTGHDQFNMYHAPLEIPEGTSTVVAPDLMNPGSMYLSVYKHGGEASDHMLQPLQESIDNGVLSTPPADALKTGVSVVHGLHIAGAVTDAQGLKVLHNMLDSAFEKAAIEDSHFIAIPLDEAGMWENLHGGSAEKMLEEMHFEGWHSIEGKKGWFERDPAYRGPESGSEVYPTVLSPELRSPSKIATLAQADELVPRVVEDMNKHEALWTGGDEIAGRTATYHTDFGKVIGVESPQPLHFDPDAAEQHIRDEIDFLEQRARDVAERGDRVQMMHRRGDEFRELQPVKVDRHVIVQRTNYHYQGSELGHVVEHQMKPVYRKFARDPQEIAKEVEELVKNNASPAEIQRAMGRVSERRLARIEINIDPEMKSLYEYTTALHELEHGHQMLDAVGTGINEFFDTIPTEQLPEFRYPTHEQHPGTHPNNSGQVVPDGYGGKVWSEAKNKIHIPEWVQHLENQAWLGGLKKSIFKLRRSEADEAASNAIGRDMGGWRSHKIPWEQAYEGKTFSSYFQHHVNDLQGAAPRDLGGSYKALEDHIAGLAPEHDVVPTSRVYAHVRPSKVGELHSFELNGSLAQELPAQVERALGEMDREGARKLLPQAGGMTTDQQRLYQHAVKIAQEGHPTVKFIGEEPEYEMIDGLWHQTGGGTVEFNGPIQRTYDATQQFQLTALEQIEHNRFMISKNGKDNLEEGHADLVEEALADDNNQLFSLAEAARDGMTQQNMNDILVHDAANGRVFKGLITETRNGRSDLFLNPVTPGTRRLAHPLALVPHPLRYIQGATADNLHWLNDLVDSKFADSKIPGGGLIANSLREFQVFYRRSANGNTLPVTEYDPSNIFRAARKVGASKDHAELLATLFSKAQINHDQALLQKVQNTITQLGRDQGRSYEDAMANSNVFSSIVHRDNEHSLWTDPKAKLFTDPAAEGEVGRIKPGQTQGSHDTSDVPRGLFEDRQWAAISGERQGMTTAQRATAHRELKNYLESQGLHPIEATGHYLNEAGVMEIEKSWFVPGLTQIEAARLGERFGQESVLTPKGLMHTTGSNAGMVQRTGIVREGEGPSGHTVMNIGGKEVKWHVPIDWNGPAVDHSTNFQSLPYGEVKALTTRGAIEQAIRDSNDDSEKAMLQEALASAGDGPAAIYTSEMFHNFALPILSQSRLDPELAGNFVPMLNKINNLAKRTGQINRRLILATDPMLFFKHLTADTVRRTIAEGGVRAWKSNRADRPALLEYLAKHPQHQAMMDEMAILNKASELHYNTGRPAGATVVGHFWTGSHLDEEHMNAAAGYIHRRIMDGAYQAWRRGGENAVRDFFTSDAKGRQLAADEGFEPEVMASMVNVNLKTIEMTDPYFLDQAAKVVADSEPGKIRANLADWMRDNKKNVPISGHFSAENAKNLSIVAKLDDLSQKIIEKYMTMNKWNRGELHYDMVSKYFVMMKNAGVNEGDAFESALGLANRVVRHHMLDLADALQAEQTLRWADYFLTKHRLYWTWIAKTAIAHPEYAVTMGILRDELTKNNPDGTSKFQFHLPMPISHLLEKAGIAGPDSTGGRVTYTVPLARLLWLDTSGSTRPGAAATTLAAIGQGNFEAASPFTNTSTLNFTTMDGALKYGLMLTLSSQRMSDVFGSHTADSKTVLTHLNPEDAYKFKLEYNRIYAGGQVDGAWKGLTEAEVDARVTHAAMISQMMKHMWANSGFTGGYVNDPRFSDEQDRIWQKYNDQIDPAARQAMRDKYPWINQQIGLYSTTPEQHTKSVKWWANFNSAVELHEQRQNALLAKFKETGNAKFLFGQAWRAEAARFSKQYDSMQAQASKMGINDLSAQIQKDKVLSSWAAFAGELHKLYPLIPQDELKGIVTKSKKPPWVNQFQSALDSSYSDAQIAALPEDFRGAAYQVQAYYKTKLSEYYADPASENKAEKARTAYFSKVYGPYWSKLDAKYSDLDKTLYPGPMYDGIRAISDASDHPVKINGIEYPSPQRMNWIMATPEARAGKRKAWILHDWSWLTAFQKSTLGGDVSQKVQDGWTAYNTAVANYYKQGVKATGTSPRLYDDQKIAEAQIIAAKHPGFMKDFLYAQSPTFLRIMEKPAVYGTPATAHLWRGLMKQALAVANSYNGTTLDPNNLASVMEYNKGLRRSEFNNWITQGVNGFDHGIPLATGVTKEYPSGGHMWKWVVAQGNIQFQHQVQDALHANPDFFVKIFSPGS